MQNHNNISSEQGQRAILRASLVATLSGIQLVTFNNYIIIFMSETLLVIPILVTLIVSSRNLFQIFFRIPLGEISQEIGRKPVIIFGHIAYTIALILLYVSTNFILAFIATLFVAIGMSAFWPAIFGYVSDWTPETFGHSNGRIFQFWDIGIIVATFLAKFILDFVKIDLREFFLLIGIIGILSTFIAIYLLPSTNSHAISLRAMMITTRNSIRDMFNSFIDISRTKLLEVYSFQFLVAFLEFMVTTFFPLLIVEQGFTKGTVSEIMLYVTIALFMFKPQFGRLTDRFSFLPTIMIILFVSSITILLMPFATTIWHFVLLYLVYTSFVNTGYNALNGETSRRAPVSLQGTALGTLGVYVSLGRTISTVSLGPIWEFVSLEAVFWVTSLVIILMTLSLSLINFNHKKRLAKLAYYNEE